MWEDGWSAYVSASTGTTEDPTPHGKLFVGKVNKGVISILPSEQALPDVAGMIRATKSETSVSFDGVEGK